MFDYRIVRWRFVVVFSLLFTLNLQTWHRDSGIREFPFCVWSERWQKYLLDWIKKAEVSKGSRISCRRNATGIVCAQLQRDRRFVNHRERNGFRFYCLLLCRLVSQLGYSKSCAKLNYTRRYYLT